jgi:hypothetical protein
MIYGLTTIDNPFDYFEQYDDWLMFDIEKGYGTNEYLARIMKDTKGFTDKEFNEALSDAIDEIIINDFTGLYKKVSTDKYD